jgi:hypothetical protein
MDRRFYIEALAERDRLKAELAAHPAYQALRIVEGVIEGYEKLLGPGLQTPVRPVQSEKVAPADLSSPARSSGDRTRNLSGKGARSGPIIEAAAQYLREIKRRAQSGEIARVLQERGIMIAGKSPSGVASSYMSQSPLFDNVQGKNGGYGLVEWMTPSQLVDYALGETELPSHHGGSNGEIRAAEPV